MDHSGNLAVIGPDGTQRGFIRAPLNNTKLVAQLPAMGRAFLALYQAYRRGGAGDGSFGDEADGEGGVAQNAQQRIG